MRRSVGGLPDFREDDFHSLRRVMMKARFFKSLIVTFLVLVTCVSAWAAAEKYPNRPVELIIGSGVGGGSDQMGRNLGRNLEKFLGVAVPCSNISGASGNVAITNLMGGKGDGYQMSTYIADTLATVVSGSARHKITDLEWITRTQLVPSYFFVKTDSPFKTIKDLLQHAKDNPGKLKVSTLGFGSLDDLSIRYFADKGFKMTNVPYPSSGERHASVLGGHADLTYDQAGDVRQFLEAKQMRPIMAFSPQRQPYFPDVICTKELGYEVYLGQFRSVVMKKGVPADRIKILADALKKAVETPEWKEFNKAQFADPNSYMGPADFSKWVYDEERIIKTFMKDFGMLK